MAFQDFDLITNRRKEEKRRRMRKRIIIGTLSVVILAGVIAAAAFAIVMKSKESKEKEKHSPPATAAASRPKEKQISTGEKMVKTMCSSTDYKVKCESTLTKAVKEDPSLAKPKDLLKAMKFETKETKGGFEDSQKLIDVAKEELESFVDSLDNLMQLFDKQNDLNNWLSAVMSYP